MDAEESNLLTVPEAAKWLRLKPSTVRARLLKRKLVHLKLGGRVFLRRSDLEEFS
jgi:excisionase family DNA binding protein